MKDEGINVIIHNSSKQGLYSLRQLPLKSETDDFIGVAGFPGPF
ncbi:MAG: hypothetical protein BWX66_01984 [Deltaproteobacteria bacterium ADurb.Bin058]|nr:MAG: hypothetical protein BWX66_01984 [Deltaproteobacteria bacterium ADurb.Bin058]